MKKKIIITSVFLLIITLTILQVYNLNYKEDSLKNKKIINESPGMISLMIETKRGSGEYKESDSNVWPLNGYVYNEQLSNCENGSILIWDEENGTLKVKTNKTDKCYVYFDVEPPNILVQVKNRPATNGKTGTINCTGSTAVYNQQYNRIEISAFDKSRTDCELTYTDSTTKTNLATYIISLAGTTQGTGEVVSETTTQDNSTFTASATLEQIEYNVSSNDTDHPYTWDSTNKTWTSTNHTDSKTATMIFNVTSNGYYQVCYKQSSEKNNDYTIFYKDNVQIKSLKGISNTSDECSYLGNLTTSNQIKVTYQKDGSVSSGTDNVIFYFQKGTYNENIKTVSAGIRYEGKDPNNYIWFNNEYWRIIGVFDSNSHGQSGKNLVKIIREDPLGELSLFDKLLNGAYYNAEDGTDSGYCYGDSVWVPTNCNYTKKGIQASYRNMIANVTWYLGGYSSTSATAEAFYGYERGTTVYSGRPTTTTGYIGLMYPSDYGYSVLSSSCARTTNLNSYNDPKCAGASWLYGKGNEWTISPYSYNSGNALYVSNFGSLSYQASGFGYPVRPVSYLDAQVYKIAGDGSLENPYIIGM